MSTKRRTDNDVDVNAAKRQCLLYRYNLATLRPDDEYKDGEDPYDKTLRNELNEQMHVQKGSNTQSAQGK